MSPFTWSGFDQISFSPRRRFSFVYPSVSRYVRNGAAPVSPCYLKGHNHHRDAPRNSNRPLHAGRFQYPCQSACGNAKSHFQCNLSFHPNRCHEPDKQPSEDKDCGDRECTPLQDFWKYFHSLAPMNENDAPSFVIDNFQGKGCWVNSEKSI